MEENTKDVIGGCFTILFLVICIAIAIGTVGRYTSKKIQDFNEFVEESIGKEIVIQGDTLTVVSYQGVGRFMLNNGVIVDKKLVKSE